MDLIWIQPEPPPSTTDSLRSRDPLSRSHMPGNHKNLSPSPPHDLHTMLRLGSGVQWQGWIKDYDSVTLMECRIDPLLPHTGLPHLFAAQRAALQQRIAAHSQSHITRPGLPAGVHPLDIAQIPGTA